MRSTRALAAALLSVSAAAHAIERPTVEGIEVRLFYTHTGTFSEPVSESSTLWNTVSGESGVREPSTSTLVKVLIAAKPKARDFKAIVQLSVREKTSRRKNVMAKELGMFSADGRQYVAFWLPQTGCDELILEASVRGTKNTVKRNIPFRCGE